jgi:hypothetical protein
MSVTHPDIVTDTNANNKPNTPTPGNLHREFRWSNRSSAPRRLGGYQ